MAADPSKAAQQKRLERESHRRESDLSRATIEVRSGGGLVRLRIDGLGRIRALEIAPEIFEGRDPDLLADLLMETKQPVLALTEFQTSLKSAPNRFHAIYGAAQAAESAHQPELAKGYYAKVVEICSQCRRDDPCLRRAQQFLAKE